MSNHNVFLEMLRAVAGLEIRNVHERRIPGADRGRAAALIDGLAGPEDRFWPGNRGWPPMRFARRAGGLREGLRGGHGPIGYVIDEYVPGRRIVFRFTRPAGFAGVHFLEVVDDAEAIVLRHEIVMHVHGLAKLSWPLAFRRLHDALLEDALDNAERELSGMVANPAAWSWQVKLLRTFFTPAGENQDAGTVRRPGRSEQSQQNDLPQLRRAVPK